MGFEKWTKIFCPFFKNEKKFRTKKRSFSFLPDDANNSVFFQKKPAASFFLVSKFRRFFM
jgi:hypothetical protein